MSEDFLNVLGVVQRVTAVTKPEYVRELERQIDVSVCLHTVMQLYDLAVVA